MNTNDQAAADARLTAPRKTRAGAVALLVLTSAMLLMDTSLISLLIEPMRRDLQFSDAQLGLLQGAFPTIAFALCAIPIGLLVDRFNRTRMILIALLVWTIALVLIAVAPAFAFLAVAKVLIGCVQAVLITAPFSLVADLSERRRRSAAVSALVIGQALGAGLGFVLGGVVYTAMSSVIDVEPWRFTVLLFGAFGVLLVPFFIVLREPARTETGGDARGVGALFRELRAHSGILWPLFVGYAFALVAASVLQVWTSPALLRLYGMSELEVGNLVGLLTLAGGIVGALLAAWIIELLRRRDRRGALAIGIAAVVGGGAGAMALMPTSLGAITVYGIGVVATTFVGTAVPTFLMLYLPNELRGLAGGALVLLSLGTGATLGPSMVALLSELLPGGQALGGAMALTGIAGGILALLFFVVLAVLTRGSRTAEPEPQVAVEKAA